MMVVLLFFIPIILPFVAIQEAYVDRKKRASALAQSCQTCSQVLGLESLTRADQLWSDHVKALHQRYPNARFRLVRKIMAVCACGAQYDFDEKKMRFFPVDDFGELEASSVSS